MGWFKGRETDSGAKTQIYMGGSQTVLGFADQAKQRNRLVLIGVGVGAVVVAVASVGVTRFREADAAARVVDSYGSLTRCLVGELPADRAELARTVREIQLASLTKTDVQRADKAGPWPDRCSKYAHGLHEALDESAIAETKGKGLLDASKALAQVLDDKDGYWKDLSAPIERTFDEAAAVGLEAKPRTDVPLPPDRARPLDAEALGKAGALSDKPLALSDVHAQSETDGTVRFVVDDSKSNTRRTCTVTYDSAACQAVPKAIEKAKGQLALLGTADDGATAMLSLEGKPLSADGAYLTEALAVGAHMPRDGRGAVLLNTSSGLELAATASNQRPESVSLGGLKVADAKRDARLLWGQLVAVASDGKDTVLAAAPVADGKLGSLVTVGSLPRSGPERGSTSEPRIEGCRSAGITVARARLGTSEFLSFFENGRWSAPLKLSRFGGTLQCMGAKAIVTSVEGGTGEASLDAKIVVQRCTPTACEKKTLEVRDFFAGEQGLASATPLAVSTVDGKLLVAWQSGLRAGLRLRVGDVDSIATLPDVVAFDDHYEGGRVIDGSTILDMTLLRSERFGVLLLVTPSGLRGLRVTADGNAVPISL